MNVIDRMVSRRSARFWVAVAVILVLSAGVSGWAVLRPLSQGTSGQIDADLVDGKHLSAVDWADVAMAIADVNINHLGPGDANLDMNGFNITNCAHLNGRDCNTLSTESLALTLDAGNVANTSIDMNGNNITNRGNLKVQFMDGYLNASTLETGALVARTASLQSATEVWNVTSATTERLRGIAVDRQGFVYAGSEDNQTTKFRPNGSVLWQFDVGATIYGIGVGPDGYVYIGDTSGNLFKVDADGVQVRQDSGLHTGDINDVEVDMLGYVYTASDDGTVKKLDAAGSEQWTFSDPAGEVHGLAVDSQGYVYAGMHADPEVLKISPSGSSVWSFSGHTGFVNEVAVDEDGSVYTVSDDSTARKLSSGGTELWSFGLDSDGYGGALDSQGYWYVGTADEELVKVDPDGNMVYNYSHADRVREVAVDDRGYVYGALDNIDAGQFAIFKFLGSSYLKLFGYDGKQLIALN